MLTPFSRSNCIDVSVLPGSFLAREARGINPGENFIRIALVAEAAQRIAKFSRRMGEA